MRAVAPRLVVAFLTFVFGLTLNWFVNTSQLVEKALSYPVKTLDKYLGGPVDVPQRKITFDSGLRTQITYKRLDSGCLNCRNINVVFRTQGRGDSEDAIVTETDFQTNKQRLGRLNSYDYQNLVRFIEAQGYFEMNVPSLTSCNGHSGVFTDVNIGGRWKSITRDEVDIAPALLAVHSAIEGALGQVTWEEDK